MTTLGKILVFLVFVAALAMGGLMVFVSKTSPDFAVAVKERDQAISVYQAMLTQEADSRTKLMADNAKLKKLLDTKTIDMNSVAEKYKIEAKEKAEQAKQAQMQQEKSDLLHKQAQAEAKRLHDENDYMRTVITAREETINKQLQELAQARADVQSAKNEADASKNRALTLYEQLKEKEKALVARDQASQSVRVSTGVKDSTYLNPPPVYVKGKIDRVDEQDKTLVKISVGSDQGVRKDQTLEAFRFSPKAEYIGRLLVVDSEPHSAICRLLRQPGMPNTVALRPGDEVASKLQP
jgi:chromosome segregation ATPase